MRSGEERGDKRSCMGHAYEESSEEPSPKEAFCGRAMSHPTFGPSLIPQLHLPSAVMQMVSPQL